MRALLDPGSRTRRHVRRLVATGIHAARHVSTLGRPRAEARVLCYHRIDPEAHRSCVTPVAFRDQMHYLRDEGYEYTVVNAGVSGDTSAGGLNRLEWSLDGDVKVLVIELGANDGLRGLPVASMKRNIAEVIVKARGRGIHVVLTGMEAPPNFGAVYTSEFRDVYRQLAREHDVIFVPFFLEGVAGIPALNQSDGIHPNAEGARIIEQTIWRALEPLLTKATHGRGNGTR